MTKVFAVLRDFSYEGMDIQKIFSTKEKAEKYVKETQDHIYLLVIEEWEVD